MKNQSQRHRFDEYTILEVFLAVSLFGMLSGAFFSNVFPGQSPLPQVVTAPTADEYHAAVSSVMLPFLSAASTATAETVAADPAVMKEAAAAAHKELLDLRVPASDREAHLAMVLLLDRWSRALTGGDSDMADLLSKTRALIETYPWLAGAPAAAEADVSI